MHGLKPLLAAALLVAGMVAPGCSKTQCEEGSDAELAVKEAPIEAEFKPYVVEGGTACGPEDPGTDWAKSQRFSYDMPLAQLQKKFKEKNSGLQAVKCKFASARRTCFADGLKRLSVEAFEAQGSILLMQYMEHTSDSLGAVCTKAHDAMKGPGDFIAKITKLMARCGEACDAEHKTSCGHLEKAMSAVCKVNKSSCEKLCSTLQGKSAKAIACKLAK